MSKKYTTAFFSGFFPDVFLRLFRIFLRKNGLEYEITSETTVPEITSETTIPEITSETTIPGISSETAAPWDLE